MWPGKHAQERPDQLAYVMAASGEAVTYRELNDRSNQLAQLLLRRRAALRRSHRGAHGEPRRVLRAVLGRAALRASIFTCINWHFNADEVAYILDDCDAQVLVISDTFRDVAAELARQDAEREGAAHGRRRPVDGYELVRGGAATAIPPSRSRRSSKARGCSTRRARPAGRRACATRSRARSSATSPLEMGMMTDGLGHGRARGLPLARAAVPLGAALLLHEHDAPRRHRDRHGAVRSRAGARVRSSSTTSRTASGCRRCSCAC